MDQNDQRVEMGHSDRADLFPEGRFAPLLRDRCYPDSVRIVR